MPPTNAEPTPQEKWWRDQELEYLLENLSSDNLRDVRVKIGSLVKEASRIARKEALEEVRELIESQKKEPQPVGMGECAFCGAWFDECHCDPDAISLTELIQSIDAKLKELE